MTVYEERPDTGGIDTWNMIDETDAISYERDWRYLLMGEAINRATLPPYTAFMLACAQLPRDQQLVLDDLVGSIRYEAVDVAVAIAEALRTMHAMPESEHELNATIEAVVERAMKINFHLAPSNAAAISDPETVKRNHAAYLVALKATNPD